MKEDVPLLVGFVADLIFISRIESQAQRLGFQVQWIEYADQVLPVGKLTAKRQYAEHLVGRGASLIDRLTLHRPALILFDLENRNIPWREWVALIKSAPATRRIPVICFGSHINVEAIKAARNAGADSVLARSRFVQNLPDLLRKYASMPDTDAIESACLAPLSALALRGLALYNQGEYFEAHEILEEAWKEDRSPGRELYRAILQVGVAYLQIQRGNYVGARKMFLRVRQWIDPLPEICRGVDVGRLRADVYRVEHALLDLDPERIREFDFSLFRPIVYQGEP